MEYTIIAGINGAGKSSLFNARSVEVPKDSVRINSDELIQKEYNHQWQDTNIQIAAGKRIVKMVRKCIAERKSFNQETTLSGRNILRTIISAQEQGYYVSLYYVGLESADLAVKRVSERVARGGHGIDEEVIRSRYMQSLENLKEVLPLCDSVRIYDNSKIFDEILYLNSKKIIYMRENIPSYMENIIQESLKL